MRCARLADKREPGLSNEINKGTLANADAFTAGGPAVISLSEALEGEPRLCAPYESLTRSDFPITDGRIPPLRVGVALIAWCGQRSAWPRFYTSLRENVSSKGAATVLYIPCSEASACTGASADSSAGRIS